MKYFLLSYDLVDDYLDLRAEFRAEHLALAKAACDRGELRLGGAFTGPADTAVLVFQGAARGVAEDFANEDPYVREGLVKSWVVREWTVVIGADFVGDVPS